MPINYHVEGGVSFCRMEGVVTFAVARDHIHQLAKDPDMGPIGIEIFDQSGITNPAITYSDAQVIANLVGMLIKRWGECHFITIRSSMLTYGVNRMICTLITLYHPTFHWHDAKDENEARELATDILNGQWNQNRSTG